MGCCCCCCPWCCCWCWLCRCLRWAGSACTTPSPRSDQGQVRLRAHAMEAVAEPKGHTRKQPPCQAVACVGSSRECHAERKQGGQAKAGRCAIHASSTPAADLPGGRRGPGAPQLLQGCHAQFSRQCTDGAGERTERWGASNEHETDAPSGLELEGPVSPVCCVELKSMQAAGCWLAVWARRAGLWGAGRSSLVRGASSGTQDVVCPPWASRATAGHSLRSRAAAKIGARRGPAYKTCKHVNVASLDTS